VRPYLQHLLLAAIFLTATGVTAFDWSFLVSDNTKQARIDMHNGIVNRTGLAPERYRVLVPYLLDKPIRWLAPQVGYAKAFGQVYAVFNWLALSAILYTLYFYLSEYFSSEQALVGTLIVASTLPITLRYYNYAPYSLLEPAFVSIGLLCIRRQAYGWFAVVVAIATLTRETAIFLVCFFVATMPRGARHMRLAVGYAAVWAAIYMAVRWYAGEAGRYFDIATVWYENTHRVDQLVMALINWGLWLGAFWFFAALGYKYAPPFVQRTALVLPLYIVTVLVWGFWTEIRLMMPTYPVLIPLALSYLFRAHVVLQNRPGDVQTLIRAAP